MHWLNYFYDNDFLLVLSSLVECFWFFGLYSFQVQQHAHLAIEHPYSFETAHLN